MGTAILSRGMLDITDYAQRVLTNQVTVDDAHKKALAEGYDRGYKAGQRRLATRLKAARAHGYSDGVRDKAEQVACEEARQPGEPGLGNPNHFCAWCPISEEDY